MRILVIEDEKEINSFIKKSLEDLCFAVDSAEDGQRGLFLAKTNNYDLVLLDNILPKKTGMEVCRELRQEGNNVPILVLSVKSETTTKVDLLNAGADDYLTKPFSLDELMARAKALLRRPLQIKDQILKIDNLTLDVNRNLVKRGGKEIYLTRKEFILLQYLMQNQSIVLSRGMILEHVWDMSVDPFSNTIESHILSLRKKVDFDGQKKLIQTISGRGYKIDESNRKD